AAPPAELADTGAQTVAEHVEVGVQRSVHQLELGDAGRQRDRDPAERRGVAHPCGGIERIEMIHDVAAPTEDAERESAADRLAKSRQVWGDPVAALRAVLAERPGDDLVEYQHDPVLARHL